MEKRTLPFKTVADKGDNSNLELLADVYWRLNSPVVSSTQAHPIAIILHGGGFVLGSKEIVPKSQVSSLTKLGFVVVVPNYRLCPQVSVWEGPISDSKDAIFWAAKELPDLLPPDFRIDRGTAVTLGHSAGGGLALRMASLSDLPVRIGAVLDFYGGKYYSVPEFAWQRPHHLYVEAAEPWLSMQDGPSYIERIFEGSQVTAATPFIVSDAQTIPPPPDAWLTVHLKKGTWLAQVLQDGDVDRVDGAKYFSATFPPTMFIHGTKDTFTEAAVSEKAYESLKALGVDTEILLVPGANHMFDIALEENDEFFREYVLKGLNFLAEKVGLLE